MSGRLICPTSLKGAGQKTHIDACPGASAALAIHELYTQQARAIVVVCPSTTEATVILEGLRLFGSPAHVFPDWEILPYDHFSAHQDITSERMRTLSALVNGKPGITIVPVHTLIHQLMPKAHLMGHQFTYHTGADFELNSHLHHLTDAGYRTVKQVTVPGEYALRGGVFDVFPNGAPRPVRLDFFDKKIESIRHFNVDTQRSEEKIPSIDLLPAREYPLDEAGIRRFRTQWRERFEHSVTDSSLYQSISEGVPFGGIEYYIPLFYEQMSGFLEYCTSDTDLVLVGDIPEAISEQWTNIRERYEILRHDIQRPLLPPSDLFIAEDILFGQLNKFRQLVISNKPSDTSPIQALPDIRLDSAHPTPLAKFKSMLAEWSGWRICVCAESEGRREALLTLFSKSALKVGSVSSWNDFISSATPISCLISPIDAGFIHSNARIVVIAEAQFFGGRVLQRRRRKTSKEANNEQVVADLAELTVGDLIVHYEQGVGRYCGLKTLDLGPYEDEYLLLSFAGNDKLYVPVSSLHLLSRYTGADGSAVQLSKLGTDGWSKAKRKAAEQASDVAAHLLDLYAKRHARPGVAFEDPKEDLALFSSSFEFEETPDQMQAIEQTLADMMSDKPMDRLVCGDVGFGKTEVAMRAAFVAVHSGKQVAVLVPTTLLAQQHYDTFLDRFAKWPVRIGVLSRFQTTRETQETLDHLRNGNIDIVVGTHKLLQRSIKFSNLGLVIVDEEHRFGVKQKETLKALKSEVDFLALTATPIPRTLNMALAAIRDLSIIATAPEKRLSIKTFVSESNPSIIKEAILRELMRSGQVYYLHNDVASIEATAEKIQALVPQAKIAVAHGQMGERHLERVMSDFYHRRFSVLVCTTIIETGIDIPTANTIIMDNANKLGLSQLHQLRGRVGRSHHQAYAYCFTPPEKQMTSDAVKRLEALSSLENLGAGFALATHDLEIRGAGELLGEGQSGNVHSVGFSLYMSLLDRAIKALQTGKTVNLDTPLHLGSEIDMRLPAIIPSDYIPDIDTRLVLYKRISSVSDLTGIDDLKVEMIDRFGLYPDAVETLFRITALKLKANPIGIQKIEANEDKIRIVFSPDAKPDAQKLISMIQLEPKRYRLKATEQLTYFGDFKQPTERFEELERLLDKLLPA